MTLISWADRAHNPVEGCTPKGSECDHCYAARLAGTRHKHNKTSLPDVPCQHCAGDQKPGFVPDCKNKMRPCVRGDLVTLGKTRDLGGGKRLARYIFNGRVALNPATLVALKKIPKNGGMRYQRGDDGIDWSLPKVRVGNRVFWNSQADTFHESLSNEEIAAQFAAMAARHDLRFLVLTKRPERAQSWFSWISEQVAGELPSNSHYWHILARCYTAVTGKILGLRMHAGPHRDWPLPNVAIGVSAGTQRMVDDRVPTLLKIPAAMRFLSAEPLLEQISISVEHLRPFKDTTPFLERTPRIDQVIIGCESGPGRRSCDIQWITSLATQVLQAGNDCACGYRWLGRCERQPLPNECPDSDLDGPALYIKQAAVCQYCLGKRHPDDDLTRPGGTVCGSCSGTGQSRSVQKLPPPKIYIPNYGARPWTESPIGWSPST